MLASVAGVVQMQIHDVTSLQRLEEVHLQSTCTQHIGGWGSHLHIYIVLFSSKSKQVLALQLETNKQPETREKKLFVEIFHQDSFPFICFSEKNISGHDW